MTVRGGCILLLFADILLGAWLLYTEHTDMSGGAVPVFRQEVIRSAADEAETVKDTQSADAYAETKPKVALTYDDGPHPVYTGQILDILAARNVPATFFVIGKNVENGSEVLQRMQEEGHLICNHTYDHVDLSQLSPTDACLQLCRTSDVIEEVTGVRPMFFRPPFGEWEKLLSECTDMLPVLWTLDTLDWKTQDSMQSYDKVVNHVKENDIILMHDFYAETVTATEYIVDYLLEEGYDLVTVDELILE